MKAAWIAVSLSLAANLAWAEAAPSAQTQADIAALIGALKASGCEFSRNGSWYDSVKAAAHLQQKYDYLLRKNLVPTTAAFIERAGSQSSVSGKAYQVRCAGQAPVNSADWLNAQLKQLPGKR